MSASDDDRVRRRGRDHDRDDRRHRRRSSRDRDAVSRRSARDRSSSPGERRRGRRGRSRSAERTRSSRRSRSVNRDRSPSSASSGGRRRRRRERSSSNPKARKSKMVLMFRVPREVSSSELEGIVRAFAIQNAFSPPENITVDSISDEMKEYMNDSMAAKAGGLPVGFLDFPSPEAAQSFLKNCPVGFPLNGQQLPVFLGELVFEAIARASTNENKEKVFSLAMRSKQQWVCLLCFHVNAPGHHVCRQCEADRLLINPTVSSAATQDSVQDRVIDPSIDAPSTLPMPDKASFIRDEASGYLYSHPLNLFYDSVSGYYFTPTGIYFAENEEKNCLVFVVKMPQQTPKVSPTAANNGGSDSTPEPLSEQPADPPSKPAPPASAGDKSLAIASILAAAKSAVQATKKSSGAAPLTTKLTTKSGYHPEVKLESPLLIKEEADEDPSVGQSWQGTILNTIPAGPTDVAAFFTEEEEDFQRQAAAAEDRRAAQAQDPNAPGNYRVLSRPPIQEQYAPLPAAPQDIDPELLCPFCIRLLDSRDQLRHHIDSEWHQKNVMLQLCDVD